MKDNGFSMDELLNKYMGSDSDLEIDEEDIDSLDESEEQESLDTYAHDDDSEQSVERISDSFDVNSFLPSRYDNYVVFDIPSLSKNESFARLTVAAFVSQLDPTIEEISDIKQAISEAVTNCCIHAYPDSVGLIRINLVIAEQTLYITVTDYGVGISDLKQAMQPLFTTRPDLERSGMGFSFMESFMDRLIVTSGVGNGTTVCMSKTIIRNYWL